MQSLKKKADDAADGTELLEESNELTGFARQVVIDTEEHGKDRMRFIRLTRRRHLTTVRRHLACAEDFTPDLSKVPTCVPGDSECSSLPIEPSTISYSQPESLNDNP